jgi:hypothetical protein
MVSCSRLVFKILLSIKIQRYEMFSIKIGHNLGLLSEKGKKDDLRAGVCGGLVIVSVLLEFTSSASL